MARFENETQDVILQRMFDRIAANIDKRQGSVTHDLLSPAAIELAQAFVELDNVLAFGFLSENTPSEYVDLRAAEQGIYRKEAVKAVGELTFTGTDGITVPVGTRVSTDETEPVYFVTTAEGTIADGTVTVTAEAEQGGAAGNVSQGSITIVLGDVSGVTAVTNAQAFDGGADTESDESVIARYTEKVEKPATSGNAFHYEQWAKSVAGVGDAKVYPLANGPGTVKVVLLDEQKTTPPQTTIDAVGDYIESVRPINASVEVVGAAELAINVSATLTLASGATVAEVTTKFESALAEYLQSLAFTGELIRYTQIANLLLDVPPIIDYANLTVNGGTANIEPADAEVGVVGAVSFA
jgi:uncharacterized phage protein gp47/JayE